MVFGSRYFQTKEEIISFLSQLPLSENVPCIIGIDNVQDYLDADDPVCTKIVTFFKVFVNSSSITGNRKHVLFGKYI
jgi:hypothetical protein